MAAQGPSDVKIFSSVRPLQIQRSFEGSADEEINPQFTVQITTPRSLVVSSTTDSSKMSQKSTVKISTSASVPNAQPAKQPVLLIQQRTSAADASPAQGKILISTGSTTSQNPVIISSGSASSTQNRVVINTTGGGAVPTGQIIQPTSPVQQAAPTPRRSSLTIKAAPAITTASNPVIVQTNPCVSIPTYQPTPTAVAAQLAEAAADVDESQHFYVEEIEHSTRVSVSRPLTWSDLPDQVNVDAALIWIMVVLVSMVVCILTENDISFVYVMGLISLGSIAAFIRDELK